MKRQVTIQDIAERTNVSKTTVSRYINGKYNFMSEETRIKIANAISEMGYRQNRLMANLSGLIGVVMSNVMSNQTPDLLGSICEACTEHGMKVIIVNSEKNPKKERVLVRELIDQRVDGLLVLSGYNKEFYQELDMEEVPVVLADRVPKGASLDSVAINHTESVQLVIDYLLTQGFQHIVILKRPHKNPNNTPAIRVKAALESCRDFFGNDEHHEIVTLDFNIDNDEYADRYNEFTELLHTYYSKSFECSTAIFVAESTIMNIVACCYYRASLKISPKFTIAGYSEWGVGSLIIPQISTIEQPLKRMGQVATEKLIAKIEQRKSAVFSENQPVERHLLNCRVTLSNSEKNEC